MVTTIRDIGEIELLNRLKKFMRSEQIDDDVAEIKSTTKNLLINTDLLVEEIHFSDTISNAQDIGWKSITTNLSDLICSWYRYQKNTHNFPVNTAIHHCTTNSESQNQVRAHHHER